MPTYRYKDHDYTLRKRGDSWQFNVRAFNPETKQVERIRKSLPTEQAADARAKVLIDRAAAGSVPQPPTASAFATPSLQKVYEMVRDGRLKHAKARTTAMKNSEDCIAILGASTPIDKVTTDRIDALITSFRDKQLEPGTIRRKLAALSTILKYAASRHWIEAMPFIDRKTVGKERKRLRFFSDQEEKMILDWFKLPKREGEPGEEVTYNADFFAFLIDTGLRLSEAVNLDWKRIINGKDGQADVISFDFENKGEQPRMVPCTERVKGILKTRSDARPAGEKRVWHDMTVWIAEHQWKSMRKALKLEYDAEKGEGDRDFVIHACRHTFASRLAQAGVPLHTIKELGGWKTLDIVMRYAHLDPASKRDAIKRVESARTMKIG
jgi:integrase